MDSVDSIVSFTSHYPAIANFVIYLSAFFGAITVMYTLKLISDVHVYKTVSVEQMSVTKLTMLLFFASCCISYAWTMTIIGGTIFDYSDTFVLDDFASTSDLAIASSGDSIEVLKQFSKVTLRLLGLIFGFWGLVNLVRSQLPEGKSEGIWYGLTRLFVAVIFAKPQEFLNMFGGFGDKFW